MRWRIASQLDVKSVLSKVELIWFIRRDSRLQFDAMIDELTSGFEAGVG
jgi:hypothetical protein